MFLLMSSIQLLHKTDVCEICNSLIRFPFLLLLKREYSLKLLSAAGHIHQVILHVMLLIELSIISISGNLQSSFGL